MVHEQSQSLVRGGCDDAARSNHVGRNEPQLENNFADKVNCGDVN